MLRFRRHWIRLALGCCVQLSLHAQAIQPTLELREHREEKSRVTISRQSIDPLLQKPSLSSAEVMILASVAGPREFTRLMELAGGRTELSQVRAIHGLGLLRDSRAIVLLEQNAVHSSAAVREAALHALSLIDRRAGHEAIFVSLTDSVPAVRRAAIHGVVTSGEAELWVRTFELLRQQRREAELLVWAPYAPASVLTALKKENAVAPDWRIPITHPELADGRDAQDAIRELKGADDPASPAFTAAVSSAYLARTELDALARSSPIAAIALAAAGEESFFDRARLALASRAKRAKPLFNGPLVCCASFISPSFVSWLRSSPISSNSDTASLLAVRKVFGDSTVVADNASSSRGGPRYFADRFSPMKGESCACLPALRLRDAPAYFPESVRGSGREAVVTLTLRIDSRGAVRDVYLASPTSSPEFVGAAYTSTRNYRFLPAFCRGGFVDSLFRVTVRFELKRTPELDAMPRLPDTNRPPPS